MPSGLRRRRRCHDASCGHRFSTAEVLALDARDYGQRRVFVVDEHRLERFRLVLRELEELLAASVSNVTPDDTT